MLFFNFKTDKVSINRFQSLNIFSDKLSLAFFLMKSLTWREFCLCETSTWLQKNIIDILYYISGFCFWFSEATAKVQLFLTMQPEMCNTLLARSLFPFKAGRYGNAPLWIFSGSLIESLWCLSCMCSRQCWKERGYEEVESIV